MAYEWVCSRCGQTGEIRTGWRALLDMGRHMFCRPTGSES